MDNAGERQVTKEWTGRGRSETSHPERGQAGQWVSRWAQAASGGVLTLTPRDFLLLPPQQVGFFKRQYKEMMEGANGQTAPENGTGDPQVAQ